MNDELLARLVLAHEKLAAATEQQAAALHAIAESLYSEPGAGRARSLFTEFVLAVEGLTHNVGRIASGGTSGPDGLELLSMSISGEGLEKRGSLMTAVADLADAIRSSKE